VEQTVRDEPDVAGRAIVEVVPVQDLMEHRLIDEGGRAQAEQGARGQVAAGAHRLAGGRCGLHPTSLPLPAATRALANRRRVLPHFGAVLLS
jgi:hypothetical protein